MALEAQIMEYVHSEGFPVPAIHEISDDGLDLVMERIDGVDMVAVISKRPWTIGRHGRVLAGLHHQLHEMSAPEWLGPAPVGSGDRLLHLDLHPLNVMMSSRGPIVIDWSGACRGDPAVDVAVTWVIMAAGEVPTNRFMSMILGRARAVLVKSFVDSFEIDLITRCLTDVVAWKVVDPHLSELERDRMWQVVTDAAGGKART